MYVACVCKWGFQWLYKTAAVVNESVTVLDVKYFDTISLAFFV